MLLLVLAAASGSPRSPIVRSLTATIFSILTDTPVPTVIGIPPSIESPPPYMEVPLSSTGGFEADQAPIETSHALV